MNVVAECLFSLASLMDVTRNVVSIFAQKNFFFFSFHQIEMAKNLKPSAQPNDHFTCQHTFFVIRRPSARVYLYRLHLIKQLFPRCIVSASVHTKIK